MTQQVQVSLSARATFHAAPEFPEDGDAYSDTMSQLSVLNRLCANAAPFGLIVLGDARVQQVMALHGVSPSDIASICLRTASILNSRNCLRKCSYSSRSPSAQINGSIFSTSAIQAAIDSGSSLHSSSVSPIF